MKSQKTYFNIDTSA